MLKKTEREGILKDEQSGALINIDKQGLNGYKLQKKRFQEIDQLKSENIMIKKELVEIKETLQMLLEKVE